MKDLKDRVVWVTGASSGIGEQLAYQLAAKGAKLILSARNIQALESVAAGCSKTDVRVLKVDLSDSFSLPAKAKEAETIFGPVDVLINNGGISQRSLILDTKMDVFRKLMEVNYFGAIALSTALLPGMVRRQSGHHVVITSTVGIINTPYRSGYGASKHALHGFYDALRAEHHDDNIKVTLAAPGYTVTNVSKNALTGDGGAQGTMDDTTARGMTAAKCASIIIDAIEKEKNAVYMGGIKERLGIYAKRFWPWLAAKVIRRIKVV